MARTMSAQDAVVITDSTILIEHLEIADEDLASYLQSFPESDWTDVIRRSVKIGLIALKGAPVTDKVDYVKREFSELGSKLDKKLSDFTQELGKKLDRVFDGETGFLMNALKKYLGEGGRLEDLFDPKRKDSAIARIREILDEHFKGPDSVVSTFLDLNNPKSPLSQLRKDLVDNYLKDMRDRLIGKEEAEVERERGTAKGREYQQLVFDKLVEISKPFGDVPSYTAEQVGKLPRCKVGDAVFRLNPSESGGLELRIVVEAKNRVVPLDGILNELNQAKDNRDALLGLAVFTQDCCPEGSHPLHIFGNDRIICTYDPDFGDSTALQVAYRFCRALGFLSVKGQSFDLPGVQLLIRQCLNKLEAITSIKRKVTRWANEVNQDLDELKGGLEELLQQVDQACHPATGT